MRRLLLQLFFVSQIILLVAWSPFSSHETEIYPGKIVNTEILSTEHNYYFDVKQVISGNIGYIPCFQLNLYDKAIHTKIGIREKIVYHYSGKGNSRKLLKKEILKGEFLEDPSEKVSEILSKGVLNNQKIKIFCVGEDKAKSKFIFLQTDENGFLIDKTGEIIKHFDDFLNNSVTLTFFHEEYGKQKFKITRNDFLEASGADIDTKRMSYRGEMQIIATSSQKKIAPGSQIELAVEIVNNSQKYMSSLLVRSFSRHSWLNGKNFYIGGLNPGERHKCTRSIYVPRIMSEGNVFLELGIADLLGPLPEEKQKLRFTIITK